MSNSSLKNNLIHLSDYNIIKEINNGGFGIVYLVESKVDKSQYAAKVNFQQGTDISTDKFITREISILIRLQSPTIVTFRGFSFKDFGGNPNPTFLMDYMPKGSLQDLLNKSFVSKAPSSYNNTAKQIILCGIARGMMELHAHRVFHRDLKPGNVLLDDNYHPYISDFGLSKYLDPDNEKSQSLTDYGSPLYMAPESMLSNRYGIKYDVYSFGILMYEVVTNVKAYKDLLSTKINVISLKNKIIDGERPKFPADCKIKPALKKLIERCWSDEPMERPSFREIYNKLSLSVEEDDESLEYRIHSLLKVKKDRKAEGDDDDDDDIDDPTLFDEYCLDDVNLDVLFAYIDELSQNSLGESSGSISKLETTIDSIEKKHKQEMDELEMKYQTIIKNLSESKKKTPRNINSCIIDISNYKSLKLVAQTVFSTVYLAESKTTKAKYAAKIYPPLKEKSPGDTVATLNEIRSDIFALTRVYHPTIVNLHGISFTDFDGEARATILMDYIEGTSLDKMINRSYDGSAPAMYNNTAKQIILCGIARGMMELHLNHIAHQNFKTSIIMLDKKLRPYIGGLSSAQYFDSETHLSFNVGNPLYMAPEKLAESPDCDEKVDVYGYGIVMYEMLSDKPLLEKFRVKNVIQLLTKIQRGERPPFDFPIKDCFKELIERCWAQKPQERPSFTEIYQKLSLTGLVDDDPKALHDQLFDYIAQKLNVTIDGSQKYILDGVNLDQLKQYVEEISI